MYLKVDYLEGEEGVSVCRCYGCEDVLEIPETVNGRPVVALSPYALSASEPAEKPQGVRQAVFHEEEKGIAGERVLAGEYLREVRLPRTLRTIGDYAFYFCRNLHTLHLQGDLKRLGGGAFVWCRSLKRLAFSGIGREHNGVSEVLSELTQELTLRLSFADGEEACLTFPEYYEESVENTPARIIDIHWHGSGYKYRQCFPGTRLSLRRYDECFPYAVANEFPDTCIRLAMNRLSYPAQLSANAREQYLSYLSGQKSALLKEGIEKRPEWIAFLAGQELLARADVDLALELAAGREDAELLSFLMDYRRKHFPAGRRSYEL